MFETILLAMDGPTEDRLVLALAAELARLHGAALLLLCVIDPACLLPEPAGGRLTHADEIEYPAASAEQESADQLVRALVARLRADGLVAEGAVVGGEPAPAILEQTRRHRAGLIVLGHRHRSWLGRLTEGSVCADVLAQARCPVLVVPEATA